MDSSRTNPNDCAGKKATIERYDDNLPVTTIVLVTVTFIGGYGLGVNDTDVRVTCFIGASGLFLFALIINLNYLRQRHAPFFRWMSQKTSFSSMSLGRMASKSSGNALSTLSRVTSVHAIKNISTNLLNTLDCSQSIRTAIQSITRKECFARLDYIERLCINDISVLYQYAADSNLDTFDGNFSLDDQTQVVRSVITAIDMAVKVSRGSLSEGTKIVSTTERSEGDIDALLFVAVTRIFAEWRNLRMVPKGFKRYAISISLGYRDVLQNLEKIERGVHEYLRHHQNLNKENNKDTATSIPSPTLRQLLQFEIITRVHKSLPRLTDKSSASGLLWTKRQLHYQTVLLTNVLEVPICYSSSEEAAKAAYQTVYTDYHGWAVKQIFTRSFAGSPPRDKIWLNICPETDLPKKSSDANCNYKICKKNRANLLDCPSLARTISDVNSATSERIDDDNDDNEVKIALDKLRHEVIEKWEDLLRMFNCGKEEKRKTKESLILSSKSHFDLNQLNRDMAESSLRNEAGSDTSDTSTIVSTSTSACSSTTVKTVATKEQARLNLIQKSKRDTEDFIQGFSPMISDLDDLIHQLNMNDPTKA